MLQPASREIAERRSAASLDLLESVSGFGSLLCRLCFGGADHVSHRSACLTLGEMAWTRPSASGPTLAAAVALHPGRRSEPAPQALAVRPAPLHRPHGFVTASELDEQEAGAGWIGGG